MNKPVLSNQHLDLKNVDRTYFRTPTNGQKYSVMDAPAPEFDAWIMQFVESIENVDRTTWDIFQRWNIINAVIMEGLLIIVHLASGDKLERPSEGNSEEKSSDSASEISSQEPSEADV